MLNLKNKIIYQIYPQSFKDSNNDGFGDLKGIISKIDYFVKLGVDVLWITPIFKSPRYDNFYDISDYYEIDPLFGTLDDLKELIAIAKQHNIQIMLDMVLNHSSIYHKWFQKALKGNKKYQEFYFFKDNINNNPPTNWKSKFGGPAWKYNPEIDKWNLALFDKTQADLNWNNPKVKSEIFKIVNYWINLGIECFRFDVINLISKPKQFIDCNLEQSDGREFYTDGPEVHNFIKQLNQNTFGKLSNSITVGELSSTSIKNALQYSNSNLDELSMVFNFHHLKVDYKNEQKWNLKRWSKKEFKNILINWQEHFLANNSTMALFLNNHDQPRINSRFGNVKKYWYQSSTLFAGLIFSLVGVPYVFQGEEIGMTNGDFQNIKKYQDVESTNFYHFQIKKQSEKTVLKILSKISRDNSRTPFQWNNQVYAGFSKHIPWIKVNKNYSKINLESQINDPNSVFSFYQKIILLRKNNSVLTNGDIKFIQSSNNLFVFTRKFKQNKLLFLFNLSQQNQKISSFLNLNFNYKIKFSNYQNKKFDFKILEPLNFVVLSYEKKIF
ncbi:alpha,alpha-phosphotrehalase [Mycoplasmopsis cricetuli]|uniref:alpha,alpha-phosphotrehalase n=1 Tax=Mycoplasmopsis cricetuli TaxID=171283 RepID=UPI000471592C|nr:alpha,alpha-phosphotrehalase [Mycoplasmopsis cricetuli]